MRIAGVSVEEFVKRADRFLVFDNPASKKLRIPQMLPLMNFLIGCKLIEGDVPVGLSLRDAKGAEKTVALESVARIDASKLAVMRPKAMVTARDKRRWHFRTYLQDEDILYIQYNRCATSERFNLSNFVNETREFCREHPVRTIIFDLQYNGGGNSALGDGMFARLAKVSPMKDRKNIFCIIGRRTFSSAILNAMRLRKKYGAVLVGEETAGSPNHFGEIKSFTLPESKLRVQYSTKSFTHGDPKANTIKPDHVVQLGVEDLAAGRDPVLDKIRELIKGP